MAALITFVIIQIISYVISLLIDTIKNNLSNVISLPVLFVALWAVITVSRNQNLKQAFRASPDNNKTMLVTIMPDGIEMKTAGNYEMKWKRASLLEVCRTPKGFCFFQAPQTGFWIPLHAFQSQNDIEIVSEMAGRLAAKFVMMARLSKKQADRADEKR
jgi:hypothetical protein